MGPSSLSPSNSTCLTTSLSRRLSLKNVSAGVLNSPMFGANGGRKRSGSRHESKHVEPSSPKVTCIGQVRVKTRKHVKKTMRARCRREGGQTSLRRSSSDQNDGGGRRFDVSENRWVHLPVTICESLRALNCLFPCTTKRRFDLGLEDEKKIELCEKWISDKTIVETEAIVPVSEEEASRIQEVDSFEEETEAMIIKTIEDDIRNAIEEEERKEVERSDQGNREPDPSPEVAMRRSQLEKTTTYKVLPDCLLLMMCEPKLSMEVSKETWVCSTDFVRCQPGRPPAKKIPEPAGDHHQCKKRIVTAVGSTASSRRRSVDKPPVHQALLQPPRSSCSYPAAPPVMTAAAAVVKQKVVGANKAYVPPMLPRCKSEPRKSASNLAPETCLWKNRKLTVGVGAAGVRF